MQEAPSKLHIRNDSGRPRPGADDMERLHPFTLLHRVIVSIPALIVVLLPALRGPGGDAWVWVAVLLVYGVAVIPLILLQYFRFRYAVTGDEIIIHSGVFTYKHRNIPIERIQNIEIVQSLLPRLLGLAKVKIETAGSSSTEGVIEFVELERARAIRASVRSRQQALRRQRSTPDANRANEMDAANKGGSSEAGGSADEGGAADVEAATGLGAPRTVDTDTGDAGQAETTHPAEVPGAAEDSAGMEAQRAPSRPSEHAPSGPGEGAPSRPGEGAPSRPGERKPSGPGDRAPTAFSEGARSDRHEEGWAEEAAPEQLHAMSLRRVLLSGAFRFSLLYIVMMFTATEYLGVEPEDVARWISGNRLEVFNEALAKSPVLVVLSTVFVVSALAWITGILTNLNRFYGFRLAYDDDKLQTRHGLLTVSEGTIPLKKVQALIIRTNPLMQAFGWYRLELQTMGFDPNDRGYRVAAPFARLDEVLSIAQRVRPFAMPAQFQSVSKIMIRRTFARYLLAFLPATAVLSYFWSPGFWLLLALPFLYMLADRQYRNHGFDTDDEYLFVRRGVFRKLLWILPAERFQVFYLTQTIFQRRLGVQSFYVDTPGSGVMVHPVVMDLPAEKAQSIFEATYARFQQLFRS